jgi:hypothetical protein
VAVSGAGDRNAETAFEPHGVGDGDIEAIWLEMVDRARSAPQR